MCAATVWQIKDSQRHASSQSTKYCDSAVCTHRTLLILTRPTGCQEFSEALVLHHIAPGNKSTHVLRTTPSWSLKISLLQDPAVIRHRLAEREGADDG
jgi:hypothetical protein